MKYLILTGAVLLLMASCSKKSSSPGTPQGANVSFTVSGKTVNIQNIQVDTGWNSLTKGAMIIVTGRGMIPGASDSLDWEMDLAGASQNEWIGNLSGAFSNATSAPQNLSFFMEDATPSDFEASDDPYYGSGFTATITANNGITCSGTFSGRMNVTSANYNTTYQVADSIFVTNGKFTIMLPHQ